MRGVVVRPRPLTCLSLQRAVLQYGARCFLTLSVTATLEEFKLSLRTSFSFPVHEAVNMAIWSTTFCYPSCVTASMATFGQHAQWPRNCPEVVVRVPPKKHRSVWRQTSAQIVRKQFRAFDMFRKYSFRSFGPGVRHPEQTQNSNLELGIFWGEHKLPHLLSYSRFAGF